MASCESILIPHQLVAIDGLADFSIETIDPIMRGTHGAIPYDTLSSRIC